MLNASSFAKQGFSTLLEEEQLTEHSLFQAITDTYQKRADFIHTMEQSHLSNAVDTIISLIEECASK